MIAKLKRFVPVLCLVAALFMAAFLPTSGDCETLRFVFMADSRGDASLPINTPVLNAIISQIKTLSPPPAFVVFGGDMAYSGYNDSELYFPDLERPLHAPDERRNNLIYRNRQS